MTLIPMLTYDISRLNGVKVYNGDRDEHFNLIVNVVLQVFD